MKKDKDQHSVSYTSLDYHTMCQKSKERIKKMQAAGISTRHDPKATSEEVLGDGQERGLGSIIFF